MKDSHIDLQLFCELQEGLIYKCPYGEVFCADANAFLSNLKSEIADVIFLDPPFNLNKKYGHSSSKKDRLSELEYNDFISSILIHSCRVLKPGGSIFLYHIPRWAIVFGHFLMERVDFKHWIAISMKNGFVRGDRLYPAHYSLLHFTKGKPSVFKRPKIDAQRCRHCGGYVKDYGGYVKYIENGINLSDVWDDISPVRHNKYKNRISNELPPLIVDRALEISKNDGGIFLDPFGGSGTSVIAAIKYGMHFLTCDREAEYCELISKRVNDFCEG